MKKTISGGERKRTAIGVELITDPSISRDTLLDLFDISLILLANNGNAINR